MQTLLRHGVILSIFISLLSLAFLILRTFSFGRRSFHAEPMGEGRKGIRYAFTRGLMPWERESARKHPVTYVAGVLYHMGIFSAMFYLLTLVIPFPLGSFLTYLVCGLVALGIVCGLGLLVKRMILSYMRKISCIDDYVSNILVNLFLILTFVDSFVANMRTALFAVTIVLFLYIPLGKIRHCFFFFYSRALFGLFFGRRGVLPQRKVS